MFLTVFFRIDSFPTQCPMHKSNSNNKCISKCRIRTWCRIWWPKPCSSNLQRKWQCNSKTNLPLAKCPVKACSLIPSWRIHKCSKCHRIMRSNHSSSSHRCNNKTITTQPHPLTCSLTENKYVEFCFDLANLKASRITRCSYMKNYCKK